MRYEKAQKCIRAAERLAASMDGMNEALAQSCLAFTQLAEFYLKHGDPDHWDDPIDLQDQQYDRG